MEGNAFGKRGRKGSEKGRGKRFNERFPKNLILCPSALEVEGEDEPGHEIAAADEPQGEHAREEERLGADHADLFEAGFHAEGAHGHGEHEDIQRIDDADGLLGDDAERVDADARDEQDGEPREAAEIIGAVGRHAAFLFRLFGEAVQPEAEADEQGSDHDHAEHLDDDGGVARINGNGLSGGYGVRDLMQGSAHEHAISLFAHVEEAVAVQEGIDEHGDGAENHDRAHGDAAFVGFALNHRFGGEYGGGPANGAPGGGEQGKAAGQAEDLDPEPSSADKRACQHDGADRQPVETDEQEILKGEAETVEDNGDAQQYFGREQDAGQPVDRKMQPERIAVNHAEHDAHDERTDAQKRNVMPLRKLIGGAGEQDDKQDAVHELQMVSVSNGFFRLHGELLAVCG